MKHGYGDWNRDMRNGNADSYKFEHREGMYMRKEIIVLCIYTDGIKNPKMSISKHYSLERSD